MLPTYLPVFARFAVNGTLDDSGCAVFGGAWDASVWLQAGTFTAPEGTSYEIYRIDAEPRVYAYQNFGVRLGLPPVDILLLPVDVRSLEMRPTVLVPATTSLQVLVRGCPGDHVAANVTLFASRRQVQP